MKIQKGLVKYKDRNDITCTYGVMDDLKQYYFIETLSNGNIIASTELVEAVDPMIKSSHVGLIDSDGNVIVPFENRSIRMVNDDVIIVERAVPNTQSVLDALEMRSDPLAATRLVSTPALIKDKMNVMMGSEGRYVFNDQFSEATICDISGNNLVNNEYYSFIGVSSDKLYMSKNTVDSDIVQYSLFPNQVQSDVTPENDSKEIDVSQVSVSQDVVENALNNEASVPVDENLSKSDEQVEDVPPIVDSIAEPVALENESVSVFDTKENENKEDVISTVEEVNKTLTSTSDEPVEEKAEKSVDLFSNDEEKSNDFELVTKDARIDESDIDNSLESILEDKVVIPDSITSDSIGDSDIDNIFDDVKETMSGLIDQNKTLKEENEYYKEKFDEVVDYSKKVTDKLKDVEKKNEKLESSNIRLEDKNKLLEDKVKHQDEIIKSLKQKLNGIGDLSRLLDTANELLGNSSELESNSTYSKVA